ncbi:MAG TPA: Rid family detoxifying hydrolase [Bacillota bacterium]|nr:RidA family protein [Fastidiosipila sp.]HPX93637.1 Rid family detoxifying hydrolase [Bacillota bacterium]HQB81503.1 Rid family detoxifying hydrolase [Bacillota bacterium]
MPKIAIHSDHIPKAIGPYSPAVASNGFLFISGQLGIDPVAGVMPDKAADQAKLALANLDTLLKEAGLGPEQVVKTTVLLTDMADFKAVNEIYGAYFPSPYPARACYEVRALPGGAKVEIECIATME